MRSRSGLLSLLTASAVVLSACSAAATPSPAPTAAAPTAAPTKTTDGTLPKPELATLKFGAAISEMSQFAPKVAEMEKIFDKYGVSVSVTVFNADGDAMQALLSGQVDMASVGAAGVINSWLTDNQSTQLASFKVKVVDSLMCAASIKTAADMKGKSVGVSTLGSTGHGSVLLALKALGMAQTDVVVTPVGGESARIAAMKAGSLACAPVGEVNVPVMQGLGFNVIVNLSTSNLPYPASGVSATNAFLKKNPNTALVVVAACLEAQNMMFSAPTKVGADWATFAQVKPEVANPIVIASQNQLNRTLRVPDGAFTFVQSVMAIAAPAISTVDAAKAYDGSYLQKLQDIGFFAKIGAPTN